MFFDLLGEAEQLGGVGAGELNVHGIAAAHDFGTESEFFGADDLADAFAPFIGHRHGVCIHGALFGAVGFHDDGADVSFANFVHAAAARETGSADGHDVLHHGNAIGVAIIFLHLHGDVVDAGDVAIGDFKGCAIEHAESALDALARHAWEEGSGDATALIKGKHHQ